MNDADYFHYALKITENQFIFKQCLIFVFLAHILNTHL